MTDPTPARLPQKRWRKPLAMVAGLVILLVAAIPWVLSASVARPPILARINRAIAPGRLNFDSVQVSWFGPTRLANVTLSDPQGAKVATVPLAEYDRNLWQLLVEPWSPSVLTIDRTRLDVARQADGKINLVEALQTIIAQKDPRRDITIKIAKGSLTYKDPELAEPLTADSLDLTIRRPASPHPLTWSLKLANQDSTSLGVVGDFDHWLTRGGLADSPDLRFEVQSHRWPIALKLARLDALARFDGTIDVARKLGRWQSSTSETRLVDLQVQGDGLKGDKLILDRLDASWDVAKEVEGWSVRRLGINSSLGELKLEGRLGDPGANHQRIEGRLDLAAIARQVPHALRLRDGLTVEKGLARLMIDAKRQGNQTTYDVEAKVSDLAARDHDRVLSLRDPATLSARVSRTGDVSSLDQFAIKTAFLDASAEGKLTDEVQMGATLDLAALRRQLLDWVDLGPLDLAGRASLTGTYRVKDGAFVNPIKVNVRDLRVDGLTGTPVRLDSLAFETTATGPTDAVGLPAGWDRLEVVTRSGATTAQAELNSSTDWISWSSTLTTPITLGDRTRSVNGSLSGTWSRRHDAGRFPYVFHASTVSQINEPKMTPMVFLAEGLLDLDQGEFQLRPVQGFAAGSEGIRIKGIGKAWDALDVDVNLSGDVEPLDRFFADWSGREPMGLLGRWSSTMTATGDGDGEGFHLSAKVGLADPTSPSTARPTTLAVRARYGKALDRLDLAEFTVSTAYGTVDASGRVDDPRGLRKVDLKGMVAPDFEAINTLLSRRVEPGSRIEGTPRTFRVTGSIGESGLKGLDAELGFNLVGLDIFGMKFGPAPVVLHGHDGRWTFEPISTTLNEGHVRLEPELDLEAKLGPTLRLAKNSTIRDARINDEVTRRVLAYVAPILDRATRVKGRVTVDLDHAEFPLGSDRGRQTRVEGAVTFNEVEFAPGPLANDLLSAVGRRDLSIKLDEPVTLTIADGRVNQAGLAIPIGNLTRIEIAGWVDFDRNLSLTATLPVTPAMLGNNELLADIASGTRVKVPITGTLNHPQIDRDALSANLQELGKSLLTRGATRGALELLKRLSRPKDPNAPPPPPRMTPEERRELRLERKAEKRARQD